MGYRSGMTNKEAVRIMELLATAHYAIASSPDPRFAFYQSAAYAGAQGALRGAIEIAYPDADVEAVMELRAECGKSVAWCVDYLARQAADEAFAMAEQLDEEDAQADALAISRLAQMVADEPITMVVARPSGHTLPAVTNGRESAVADWLIKRNVALPGLSYQEAAESIVAAIDRADWRMAFGA